MQTINIITRCTRPNNLPKVMDSVFHKVPSNLKINWHVLFDTVPLKDIDAGILSTISSNNTKIHFVRGGDGGLLYPQSTKLIKTFDKDSWFYFLDDDNIIHEDFYKHVGGNTILENNSNHLIHVVSQQVDGKDFTGLDVRVATPENTGFQKTDIAQVIIKSELIDNYSFGASYAADGYFIQAVLDEHPEYFSYHNLVLSHYNYLEKKAAPKLPRILYIGEGTPDLKSKKWLNYESEDLDVRYLEDDQFIRITVAEFNPDMIVTRGEHWAEFRNVANMPLQFRKKWIHVDVKDGVDSVKDIGEWAYNCSMHAMLNTDNLDDPNLISFFTPIYNTGQKLRTTYKSVAAQTYENWEWILMNDSTDGGKTLKIAEEIAAQDPRVKVYDLRKKSGGCIGEVKWRACSMATGYILAELDHDDILADTCAQDLHDAAQAHPECGFFFGDTAEIYENGKPHTYPPDGSFALGYGNYRDEKYHDMDLIVCNQHNINPKTIRHIVGVPNHIRAWRRSTYFEIGGHNRSLTVADDYELVIRTFLNTIMCKIPKLSYIQLIYNNAGGRNTHDLSREDIQRRTRTISDYYNEDIKNRFEELGVHDWAYEENPDYPIHSKSRFGKDEGAVNITYIKENENIHIPTGN